MSIHFPAARISMFPIQLEESGTCTSAAGNPDVVVVFGPDQLGEKSRID
jgi:hypothetical protein